MAVDGAPDSDGSDPPARSGRKLSPGPGLPAKKVAAHQLVRIHRAMTEIVAAQGYKALKVRDVVRLAEVSTRAFYEHFSSKEDCFLQTYDLIARRATRRIIAAQAQEQDWQKRPRLILQEFIRGLESKPEDTRLALLEAYTAGPAPLEQAWRAERIFEGMLIECFARSPGGVTVPPMVAEGMVAGIAGIARDRLSSGRVKDLSGSSEQLVNWAVCYLHRDASELAALDRQSIWRDTTLQPLATSSMNGDVEVWSSTGDRALILAAVARLAAEKGYAGLTAPRIRAAAGVSRNKFNAHFDDVEDCYLAALDQRVGEAMAQAARAQTAAESLPGGVYRAIAALCRHIAGDPFLTRLCLTDDFPPGPDGARARQRSTAAVIELLGASMPPSARPSPCVSEALTAAVWSLFHHHVIRSPGSSSEISAHLTYMTLAPALGATEAIAAIRTEQRA
jgi:AcrR family transcriptional regulator